MPYQICHVYVALQYSKNPQHTIGSIFPDVTHLLVKDKKHILMKAFIKDIAANKENKEFIDGIKTHIALDHYFHEKYIYRKRDILMQEFSLHPSTAEGYIEMALDKIIDKQHPEVARTIKQATKTKKFASYLSREMHQPLRRVKKALRDARLIARFKNPYKLRTLLLKAIILRKYLRLRVRDFKFTHSKKIFRRAEQLIKDDYSKELSRAIKVVERLRKNPFR